MVKRTTIRDVAEEAGVSPTAVSLVLNNRPSRVSDETRRLIVQAAEKLHYVPNQVARTLVTQRSMLMALIVPDIQNLFFAALAKRVEDECHASGYSLIISNTDDSRSGEHEVMERLAARGADGMFIIPAGESCLRPEEFRHDVEALHMPVVLMDRLADCGWCDGVGIDNREGARLAAQLLLDCGHRRIACVSGGARVGNAGERCDGFMEALRDSPQQIEPVLLIEGDYRFSGGYVAADAIVDAGATAVFCCNDLMAMGVIRRLNERGLHVPDDLSVVGYDGLAERFGFGSEVTTIGQKIGWLSHEAWQLMVDRMKAGSDKPPRSVMLPPELVKHGTVKVLRAEGSVAL